LSSV